MGPSSEPNIKWANPSIRKPAFGLIKRPFFFLRCLMALNTPFFNKGKTSFSKSMVVLFAHIETTGKKRVRQIRAFIIKLTKSDQQKDKGMTMQIR
jgi:hypothetical protein